MLICTKNSLFSLIFYVYLYDLLKILFFLLITARIHSMMGRYCFYRCLSGNILGGYPIQVWMVGGTPSQVWGYPIQVWIMEGTPSQVWGVPHPGLDGGGYPISGLGWGIPYLRSGVGVPHLRSWTGGTPSQVWGTHPGLDGGGLLQPGLDDWGTPQLGLDGRGHPPWDGVPPRPGMGYPPPPLDRAA